MTSLAFCGAMATLLELVSHKKIPQESEGWFGTETGFHGLLHDNTLMFPLPPSHQ